MSRHSGELRDKIIAEWRKNPDAPRKDIASNTGAAYATVLGTISHERTMDRCREVQQEEAAVKMRRAGRAQAALAQISEVNIPPPPEPPPDGALEMATPADTETLPPARTIMLEIPSHFWDMTKRTHGEALVEIDRLARVLATGTEALSGLYRRICDLIRKHELTTREIQEIIGRHIAQPRVSELVRIARASPEVYRRYQGCFMGFKAALAECRGGKIGLTSELRKQKMRRAAERLILLMEGQGQIVVRGHRVVVFASAKEADEEEAASNA